MKNISLYNAGLTMISQFVDLNQNVMPPVTTVETPQSKWMFKHVCAYYRRDTINICLIKCRGVRNSMGRNWNWPGSTTDKTPYGVLAHELGHHADFHSGRPRASNSYMSTYSTEVKVASKEKPLTSYCPNDGEWFAEMFRLFVTNTDLLLQIRPNTYDQLTKRFCPLPAVPWQQALEGFVDDAGATMRVPGDITRALKNKGAK